MIRVRKQPQTRAQHGIYEGRQIGTDGMWG
jgi:hypothetical protein